MRYCEYCAATFDDRDPRPINVLEDALEVLCPDCLAAWRASREQLEMQARERNRLICLEHGHAYAPGLPFERRCLRCGHEELTERLEEIPTLSHDPRRPSEGEGGDWRQAA